MATSLLSSLMAEWNVATWNRKISGTVCVLFEPDYSSFRLSECWMSQI